MKGFALLIKCGSFAVHYVCMLFTDFAHLIEEFLSNEKESEINCSIAIVITNNIKKLERKKKKAMLHTAMN